MDKNGRILYLVKSRVGPRNDRMKYFKTTNVEIREIHEIRKIHEMR